jgi:hypothetical protein
LKRKHFNLYILIVISKWKIKNLLIFNLLYCLFLHCLMYYFLVFTNLILKVIILIQLFLTIFINYQFISNLFNPIIIKLTNLINSVFNYLFLLAIRIIIKFNVFYLLNFLLLF